MELPYQVILKEIVESSLLDLCFKAHRAIKQGYFCYEDCVLIDGKFVQCDQPQEKNGASEKNDSFISPAQEDVDIFGYTNNHVVYLDCPHCKGNYSSKRFSTHLAACMNIVQQTARNTRNTVKSYIEQCNSDFENGDSDYEESTKKSKKRNTSQAKRKRKHVSKITATGEACVSSSSDGPPPLLRSVSEMAPELIPEYLNESSTVASGQIGRHYKKMFKYTHNLPQPKSELPLQIFDQSTPDLTDDVQIDVDTVDEEEPPLISAMPGYPKL